MPGERSIPEFEFRDGMLRISEPHSTAWVRGWPEPAAQRKLNHGSWSDYRPSFRLFSPPTPAAHDLAHAPEACDGLEGFDAAWAERKRTAYTALRQTLPSATVEALEKFVSHPW